MKNTGKSVVGGREWHNDNRILGLSYVGGGAAWFLHLLLAYLAAEFGCVRGWNESAFLGITAVAWLILWASALTLAGAVAATALSYGIGRRRALGEVGETGETVGVFSGRATFVANLIFAFVILVESLPIFYYLHDC